MPDYKPEAVPRSHKAMLNSVNKRLWQLACEVELENHRAQKTHELYRGPTPEHVLSWMWVYATKPDEKGYIEKLKARLVIMGNHQLPGEYNETYAPCAKMTTLRLCIAIAAKLGLKMGQADFVAAYLNSELKEELYVYPPPGQQTYTSRLVERT
jgi:hypothetical protein